MYHLFSQKYYKKKASCADTFFDPPWMKLATLYLDSDTSKASCELFCRVNRSATRNRVFIFRSLAFIFRRVTTSPACSNVKRTRYYWKLLPCTYYLCTAYSELFTRTEFVFTRTSPKSRKKKKCYMYQ